MQMKMKMKDLEKGGQLIEIEPEEVSLVKHPAKKRRFLFTQAADLEIKIKTDQIPISMVINQAVRTDIMLIGCSVTNTGM